MQRYSQNKNPFSSAVSIPDLKNTHWIKPHLIAEIEFKEWTSDNIVRQPSFKGLRLDKKPKDVTRENEY